MRSGVGRLWVRVLHACAYYSISQVETCAGEAVWCSRSMQKEVGMGAAGKRPAMIVIAALLVWELAEFASEGIEHHPPPPAAWRPPNGTGNSASGAVAAMSGAELEAFYQVAEAFLEDGSSWRTLHPRPCTQDLPQGMGMLCEQGPSDKLMHVTRLQFGAGTAKHCKLGATLPGPALAQLPHLKTLLVSECIMSQRTSIPAELSSLDSLEELSLRSNKALVGSVPATLSRLHNLQVLSLSQNNLDGPIPSSLGSLKSLQHLDLSYNVLSGQIPPSLGQLFSLSILDLSGNLLRGSIPPSLGSLRALQKLDLSSNQLASKIPPELGSLTNLQFLALSQNGFTGPLPSTLSKLHNMEYFLMDGNPLHGALPGFLAGWTQLRELSMSNSFYTGTIPSNVGGLYNVSVINLSNNKLDGSIPLSLEQMHQLNYLNLSENFLTGPVPFSGAFIQKLGSRLDVHGNPGLCVSEGAAGFSGVLVSQLHTCNTKIGAAGSQGTSGRNSAARLAASSVRKSATAALAVALVVQFFR